MTVGQLKKILTKYSDNTPVITHEQGGMYDCQVKCVNPDNRDGVLKVRLTIGYGHE